MPTSTVYVCLVNGSGAKLINERTFTTGETIPTETAPTLLLTLGNASVRMKVNGKAVPVAPSSSAIRLMLTPTSVKPVAAVPDSDLPVSTPRAGILVTGTEVLTGIISDRNGPWLSERLREIGVDAAVIQIVGDRRDDMLEALRYMASRGDGADRDQRRAGADRRRPDDRDRRGVQRPPDWCSTTAWRGGSRRSSRR